MMMNSWLAATLQFSLWAPYCHSYRRMILVYFFLKVAFNGKEILVYEDLLECGNVILLIEYQHSLFVVNRVNAPE